MLGSHALLSLLIDEGVTHLFGNPGTTELPLMAALPDYPQIDYVLGAQEAAVVAMADGYARASGRLAACNLHVAPGLGNAVGSLFNASWIGSPLIVTAGQHPRRARPHRAHALRPARADGPAPRQVGGGGDAARRPAPHRAARGQDRPRAPDRARVHLPAGQRADRRRRGRSGPVQPGRGPRPARRRGPRRAGRPPARGPAPGDGGRARGERPIRPCRRRPGWPSCWGPASTRTPFPPRPRSYRRTRASWACSAATSETWRSVSAPTTCCSASAPTCCACRCRGRRRSRRGWPSCRWGSGRPTSPRTTRPSWRCRRTSVETLAALNERLRVRRPPGHEAAARQRHRRSCGPGTGRRRGRPSSGRWGPARERRSTPTT